jgi:hypothetical protein
MHSVYVYFVCSDESVTQHKTWRDSAQVHITRKLCHFEHFGVLQAKPPQGSYCKCRESSDDRKRAQKARTSRIRSELLSGTHHVDDFPFIAVEQIGCSDIEQS